MRLLTMLATGVLLAGCVHDTGDFEMFTAESGVSLTYYIGSTDKDGGEWNDPWNRIHSGFPSESVYTGKNADDPWDRITEMFALETVYTGSGKVHDDPWNRINELFPTESCCVGKFGEEDPWNRIQELFPDDYVHGGKTNGRYLFGIEKSDAEFLSFSYQMPTTDRALVTEVRGRVLRLEFTDGVEQYVIDAPAGWTKGTQLETGFVGATSKQDRPLVGVRFWRTVEGSDWEIDRISWDVPKAN